MNHIKKIVFASLVNLIISCGSSSQTKTISSDEIQGYWHCKEIQYDYTSCDKTFAPNRDADITTMPANLSWLVKGDSMWLFQFPCEFLYSSSFVIRNDSIYLDGNQTPLAQIKIENGLLKIITPGNSVLPVKTETFMQESYDPQTAEKLKHDTIDLSCLKRKMKIITTIHPIDEAPYEITFPVSMPAHIDIATIDEAEAVYKKRMISLQVENKTRLFVIKSIDWNNFGTEYNRPPSESWNKHTITLSPAEWWTGEPFTITYIEE